jgi:hypothetical protein
VKRLVAAGLSAGALMVVMTGCGPAAAISSSSSSASTPIRPPAQSIVVALPVLVVHPFAAPGPQDYAIIRPVGIGMTIDVNAQIRNITWAYWTASNALGHGSRVVDDCNPNCAAGTIRLIPETVTLSAVVGGQFTSMTETYNGQTFTWTGLEVDVQGTTGGTKAALPPVASASTSPSAGAHDYNDPTALAQAVAEFVRNTSGQTVLHSVCVVWPSQAHKYTCTVDLASGPDIAAVVVSADGSTWTIVSSG